MERIKTIQIKQDQINIKLCSAVDQRSILLMLAKYGLEGVISGLALDHTKANSWERFGIVVVGVLLNKMPINETEYICDKLLEGAMIYHPSEPEPLEMKFFDGRMEDYFDVIKSALEHNFKGFFPYLDRMKRSLGGSKNGQAVENKKT